MLYQVSWWLYPKKQNTDGTVSAVTKNSPAKIFIAKVLNFETKILASAQSTDEAAKALAAPVLAVHTRNLQLVFEAPPTSASASVSASASAGPGASTKAAANESSLPDDARALDVPMVVKSVVCGAAVTVCGVPVLILTSSGGNSSSSGSVQIATQLGLSGDALLRFLDGATGDHAYYASSNSFISLLIRRYYFYFYVYSCTYRSY